MLNGKNSYINFDTTIGGLSLKIATIVSADPVHQLYSVLPVGSVNSVTNCLRATPLNTHSNPWSGVQQHRVYRQGDIVLLAVPPSDLSVGSQMPWCVILGTVNAAKFKYIDESLNPTKPRIPEDITTDFSKFYDDANVLFGADNNKRLNIGFYLPGLEYAAGGDYLVRGDSTVVRVSDKYIHASAGLAYVVMGGAYNAICQTADVFQDEFLGGYEKRSIINGDTYFEAFQAVGPSAIKAVEPKLVGILTQSGDLPYGYRRTVVGSFGGLSVMDQRLDGLIHQQSIAGFISDKVVNVRAFRSAYDAPVVIDKSIAARHKDATAPVSPFDSVQQVESPNWDKIAGNFGDLSIIDGSWLYDSVFSPTASYFCKYPEKTITDATEAESEISTALCASRLGQLPDGSIVLRDAWGSEIRMSQGDIQLSAARKIVGIGSDDLLLFAGGVTSINSDKGINIGSRNQIDVVSNSLINVSANSLTAAVDSLLKVYTNRDLFVSVRGSIVSTVGSYTLSTDSNYLVTATGQATITGKHSAGLQSVGASIIAGAGVVEIAGNYTKVVSNVSISSGTCNHKLGDELLGRSSSQGMLTVTGSVLTGGNITATGTVSTAGIMAADMMIAKNVSPGTGVFKTKNKIPKPEIEPVDCKYTERTSLQGLAEVLSNLRSMTLEQARSAIFTIAKTTTAFVRPLFSRWSSAFRKENTPTTVVKESGKVYIYPGAEFWEGSGMVTLTPMDVESLSISQQAVYNGAITLQLLK